jgi:gluconokinase
MTDYFIGTDIGTGSVKSLAIDAKGKVRATSQILYPPLALEQGRYEQNPEVILQSFINSISEVVQQMNSKPAGLGLSSAMHSVLFVNDNGAPITNLITWADNRAGEIATKLKRSAIGEMLYEQNGTPIHAMSPLCKLIWFKDHEPEMLTIATKIISIKEYIWSKLFHVYEADHSLASASGLMNIETLSWNESALNAANVRADQLSTLVSTSFHRSGIDASLARQMGIDPSTKIIIGGSDGCMANLGSFATDPGIGALTIGTSGAIRVASKKPVCNFTTMPFNYRLDLDTFICGGPTNNGGVVLKWYAESFLGKKLETADDYNELLKPVKSIDYGADGLIFLPYILGERAPIWNSNATGVFFGIKKHHTQKHFTRAVLEGISMALFSIASGMEQSGLAIEQINVSGGFVHSNEWLEIMTNIFGKKLSLINASDASAMGAAYMGMKTLGMIQNYNQLKNTDIKEIFPEQEIHERYLHQFKRYQSLYSSLADNMTSDH